MIKLSFPEQARTLRGGRLTKWKGQVASMSPMIGQLVASASPTAMAVVLGKGLRTGAAAAVVATAGIVVAPSGAAACTLIVAGDYDCTTSQTTTQTLIGLGVFLDVDVDPVVTFDTTGSGGNAFSLTGASFSGIEFTQAPGAGDITGAASGIDARLIGLSTLTIDVNGAVSGLASGFGYAAIFAETQGAAGDLTITTGAGDINAGQDGIRGLNDGVGDLIITTGAGDIIAGNDGIEADTEAGGGSLTVTTGTGTITAGQDGVSAVNDGNGATTVTVNGDINTASSGMFVQDQASTGAMTITTAASTTVTGAQYGIFGDHDGSGLLTINAYGAVIGTASDGIEARANLNATGISITTGTGTITGGQRGIDANIQGSAAAGATLTIDTNGDVFGSTNEGIDADNAAGHGAMTITTAAGTLVSGGTFGINADHDGSGDLTITANGAVTGTVDDGISADNGTNGANLTVTTGTGAIQGGDNGIDAYNSGTGTTILTVGGDVRGNSGDGIEVTDTNAAGAMTITTAAGTQITGDTYGIYAEHDGAGDLIINALGAVTGNRLHGVSAINGSYGPNNSVNLSITTGAGDIYGDRAGIRAINRGTGDLTVTTGAGNVEGANDRGIVARNISSGNNLIVVTGAGTVTGGNGGIYANNQGRGILQVTTNGDVIGLANSGIFVNSSGGAGAGDATVTTAVGTIVTGATIGIQAQQRAADSDLTINAYGNVTGTNGDGINAYVGPLAASLTVTTGVGSTVLGATDGIDARNLGTSTTSVTVNGNVTGTTGRGIYVSDAFGANSQDMTVTTAVGSTVIGSDRGISARHEGTGNLIVNAYGTVTSTINSAIYAGNGSLGNNLEVTTGTATINGGGGIGIWASNAGSGVTNVTANGDVLGGNRGILALTTATTGALTINTSAGNTITGGTTGIQVVHEGINDLVINALGTVTGTNYAGIYARNGATGGNLSITTGTATVSGGAIGIRASNQGNGTTIVNTSGNVYGYGTGSSDHGISVNDYFGGIAGYMSVTTAVGTVVRGGRDGIRAVHTDSGDLTIIANGAVTGLAGIGINARTANGQLNITAQDVTGASYGILARQLNAGQITVTVSGTVTASGNYYGIHTRTGAGGLSIINLLAGADLGSGSGLAISNGAGDSQITVTNATLDGVVSLGDGSDTLTLNAGATLGANVVLDGGDDIGTADGFVDVLTMTGITANFGAGTIRNWEEIALINSTVSFDGLLAAELNVCGGSTTLGGASSATNVLGCVSADQITIDGTTIVSGNIEGAGGSDSIAIIGAASVTGGIYGGGAGSDASAASDDTDIVIINTTGTVGLIDTDQGDDLVLLQAGTVTGAVTMGDGDDDMGWNGGTLGSFAGGDGGDTLIITSSAGWTGTQVLDGGDDLSIADGFSDRLDISGFSQSVVGANLQNWEVISINSGFLSFSDNAVSVGSDASTGLLVQNGATLDGLNQLTLTGNLQISNGGVFIATGGGNGAFDVTADMTLDGFAFMFDGAAGDVLVVGGDLSVGNTAALVFDVDLSSDGGVSNDIDAIAGNGATEDSLLIADQVIVAGDMIGSTDLVVNNYGVGTSLTDLNNDGLVDANEGRLFAQVAGTASANSFVLNGGTIYSGAFMTDLYSFGPADSQSGGWDFVLATTFSPATPAYETLPSALLALADVDTLEQRIGNRQWLMGGDQGGAASYGIWMRVEGERSSVNPEVSTTLTSYDVDTWNMQMGMDFEVGEFDQGTLYGGIFVSSGQSDLETTSVAGATSTETEGFGVGATLTWYGTDGFYADAQAVRHDFESDLVSSILGDLASDVAGSGTTLSLELGQEVATTPEWTLIPQAQLVWSSVDFDSFTGPNGEQVSAGNTDSLRLGLGLSAERDWVMANGDQASFYGTVTSTHEFRDATGVVVDGTSLTSAAPDWTAEIGIGGSYAWNDGGGSVYGEVSASEALGSGDASSLSGSLGLQFQF